MPYSIGNMIINKLDLNYMIDWIGTDIYTNYITKVLMFYAILISLYLTCTKNLINSFKFLTIAILVSSAFSLIPIIHGIIIMYYSYDLIGISFDYLKSFNIFLILFIYFTSWFFTNRVLFTFISILKKKFNPKIFSYLDSQPDPNDITQMLKCQATNFVLSNIIIIFITLIPIKSIKWSSHILDINMLPLNFNLFSNSYYENTAFIIFAIQVLRYLFYNFHEINEYLSKLIDIWASMIGKFIDIKTLLINETDNIQYDQNQFNNFLKFMMEVFNKTKQIEINLSRFEVRQQFFLNLMLKLIFCKLHFII